MAVTSEEIARRCGVSRGTVDRALHGRDGVSRRTRERILEAAEELGYRPHALARSLVLGRTLTIGMVTLDLRNSFISELVSYSEVHARKHGYFTYVTNTGNDASVEVDCINHLVDRKVDGIIVQSVHPTKDYARWLTDLPVPVVAIGNRISANVPFVGIDDRAAAYDATSHIRMRGYERIALVCPPLRHIGSENIDAQEQRYLGFLDFHHSNEALDDDPVVIRSKDLRCVTDIARANLPRRTAFFCTSDIFALEVLSVLRDSGLGIPGDVGVMGFDNIAPLRYVRPKLTTVDQEVEEISRAAIDQLVALMNNESVPAQTECSYQIIAGETT